MMSKYIASVLSTVNAPFSKQLDGAGLAHCLTDMEAAKAFSGQVGSFLIEVPLAQQKSFAAEYGISAQELKAFAEKFSAWSGESRKLIA
jgi:hypothetical protein